MQKSYCCIAVTIAFLTNKKDILIKDIELKIEKIEIKRFLLKKIS